MFENLPIDRSNKSFCVGYDPANGKILGIFRENSRNKTDFVISIDDEIADRFNCGEFNPSKFVVDIKSKKLRSLENKIQDYNDVLLRVPFLEYIENPECIVTFDSAENTLEFNLNTQFEYPDHVNTVFYLTKYNDPTIFYEIVELSVKQIRRNSKIKIKSSFDNQISFFTKKLFHSYGLEIK